jgi:AraC family transcriptional regulator of adaptative response/methylated-DNA-[protein]-cysteine methyltransferase
LIATTQRGICKLAFFDDLRESDAYIAELRNDWRNANVCPESLVTKHLIDQIFSLNQFAASGKTRSAHKQPLRLYLKGTPFQQKVWQALLSIPDGHLCSYQQLADAMGASSSVRAVASAIAKNHIAYLIPCHRVIKSTGVFNEYRWGALRKKVMISKEAASIACDI